MLGAIYPRCSSLPRSMPFIHVDFRFGLVNHYQLVLITGLFSTVAFVRESCGGWHNNRLRTRVLMPLLTLLRKACTITLTMTRRPILRLYNDSSFPINVIIIFYNIHNTSGVTRGCRGARAPKDGIKINNLLIFHAI